MLSPAALQGLPLALTFRSLESYYLFISTVAWLLAWGAYWSIEALRRDDPFFRPWGWLRVVGVALILWPFVKLGYGIYTSFGLVLDPNSVVRTTPESVWWTILRRRSLQYIVFPLVGAFLAFGLHERLEAPPRLRNRIRLLLERISSWPRRSFARDLANGSWLFVAVFMGYVGLNILLSPLERLNNGEEQGVFDALTPLLALLIALMAGVTEELLFRGILQNQLQRLFPLWFAIGIQSLFFGLIHSGYGTIGHILFPALFGVMMGIIMVWFGLVPAIMVHAGVDLVIFLMIISETYAWTPAVVTVLFFVAVLYPALYYLLHALRAYRSRQADPPGGTGGPGGGLPVEA